MGPVRVGIQRRLSAEAGFTLVELMVALLILTGGILAVAASFDFSRASTDQSELKTAAIDRAQREIEAVRSLPYEQVAHPTGGVLAPSGDAIDPTSRIAGANFKWNRANPSASEPLVVSASGEVPMRQVISKGDEDRFGYTIWRFVTDTPEPACASAVDCEDDGDSYRRVTVVVRADGLGNKLDPVWTSTTVIDPARAANNDGKPQTLCQNEAGSSLELCSKEAEGEDLRFYLTNTPANLGNVRQAIPADPAQRKLHKTVRIPASCTASNSNGCPVPDLMVETGLPLLEADDPVPPLVSFATDVTPTVAAGRPLVRDSVLCNQTPTTTDDLKGAYWVSPALAHSVKVNGRGTLRLYSQSWSGADHDVDVCVAIYSVPSTINNPVVVANQPTQIGRFTRRYRWPGSAQPLSLDVYLGLSQSYEVAAGRRIGLRLWLASSSGDDVVLLYDHNNHQSALTLVTTEED